MSDPDDAFIDAEAVGDADLVPASGAVPEAEADRLADAGAEDLYEDGADADGEEAISIDDLLEARRAEEDVPAEDAHAEPERQPDTQGEDPAEAELGEDGEGDLTATDGPQGTEGAAS